MSHIANIGSLIITKDSGREDPHGAGQRHQLDSEKSMVRGGKGSVLEWAREVGSPFGGGGEEKAHRRRCFHRGAARPMAYDCEGPRRRMPVRFAGSTRCFKARWCL
jgi:hypothetical protein